MNEKPLSPSTSNVSVPKTPSGGGTEVKSQIFSPRDPLSAYARLIYDAASERVWRNCLYPEHITFDQFYRMYARNNVAARVIETFPDYCWAAMPFVTDEAGQMSRFSKAASALLTKMYDVQDDLKQSLLTSMKQLDVLGGIGGEALLIFGFADGKRLESSVTYKKGMEISWVKVLHNGQFAIDSTEDDETKPNFGNVRHYVTKEFTSTVDLNFQNRIAPGVKIHATRCVHFKESNGLSYGTSRIQKCYNQLLDITKLSGASAEVYWLGAFSGLSIETDPTAQLSDDSYKRMQEDVAKYFDGLGRALVFEGAKTKLLYPAIVSPKDHFDLQITMISIATGIPRRFLTGAEAAKLASQQDTLNWNDRVTNRREMFVGPRVVSPVIQRCIDAGVIPRPRNDSFFVAWPRVQAIALNERADASRNMTAAWNDYFASGMAEVVPFNVYLLYACGFSESEATDIAGKTEWTKWKKVQKRSAAAAAPAPVKKKDDEEAAELEERIAAIESRIDELPNLFGGAPRSDGARTE